jgi:3-phenylpropionate/trans-cinnamate dioxygenase ferredoxin subunit
MAKHVIASLREFPAGTRKLVDAGGRQIAVFNIKDEFFALANRCPHQGGSLCEGRLIGLIQSSEPGQYRYSRRGEIIRCPWHGWEFDLRTGKSWCDPSRIRARQFSVSVAPGATLVEGPYVAETFSVSVEDDYVVLEV